MNIQQALKKIGDSRQIIEKYESSIEGLEKNPREPKLLIKTEPCVTRTVFTDKNMCIALLREVIEYHQARVDRLMPIVDMANAALRGIDIEESGS